MKPLLTETKRNCESVAQNKECFGIGGTKSNGNICSDASDHYSSRSIGQLYASFRRVSPC